ncbi:MAG: APC family permease [Candidatus Zhuqueibacterota bacterium]
MSNELSEPKLLRVLGPLDTTAILIGSVIGSGIFLVPNTIATQVGSFGLMIFVWFFAGLLSLFGALSYAELGGMIPHAGGQYVYLREAYGIFPAFLFGWTEFLVIKAGSVAAVAVAFALYVGYFIPESFQALFHKTIVLDLGFQFRIEDIGVKAVAILCIIVLSIVNYLGVKLAAWIQNIFTFLKVAALAGLIVLTFIAGHASPEAFKPLLPAEFSFNLLSAFGVAMVAALWAYDGWNNTTYVAAEVKEPQRTIPRALFLGTSVVIIVYLAANWAYAYVLPIKDISTSTLVAADAMKTFLGPIGGALISAAVMISTFGTVNGMILSGARVTYAMADDRVFFRSMGDVHPRFRTPHVSVTVQGIWAAILTLSGRFDQLFTYVIFAAWLFYGLTTSAVLVLRKKWPNVERPYKTWGYPWIPIAFILVSILFVINTLITDPRDSLFGLIIVALGVPVYLFWNFKSRKEN